MIEDFQYSPGRFFMVLPAPGLGDLWRRLLDQYDDWSGIVGPIEPPLKAKIKRHGVRIRGPRTLTLTALARVHQPHAERIFIRRDVADEKYPRLYPCKIWPRKQAVIALTTYLVNTARFCEQFATCAI